ncbi:MAG: glycosyltransferase [Elusimicrobia bacterium]|nr:glycosyltransferase [Elusimicrobiota bacterium]
MAQNLERNPQSLQLQVNYGLALFMLGYLDYAWKVSCYSAAQFINEKNPFVDQLFAHMENYFFTITHSDRGENEIDLNGKKRTIIRHRDIPPPDYRVIFPFSKEKISLCMIAKNEESCIAKALASVRDYVDEIILVDTGSTDKTCHIASCYGAKIYHHPWGDDFSESRNHSLGYATGDWILILDADETINYLDMIYLRELAARKDWVAYSLRQRHYTKEGNSLGLIENNEWYNESIGYPGWLENIICRFFKRSPVVYYKRPVHEAVEYRLRELDIMPLILEVPIHHYGKLSPPEKRDKKSQHYININKEYLKRAETREDIIWCNYQIGQSLAAMRKPEEALPYLEECVRGMNQGKPLKSNDSAGGPVIALSTLYLMLGRPQDALEHLKRQVAIEPENDEYLLALAQVYIHLGDFRQFVQNLDKCLLVNPENEKAKRMREEITNGVL